VALVHHGGGREGGRAGVYVRNGQFKKSRSLPAQSASGNSRNQEVCVFDELS